MPFSGDISHNQVSAIEYLLHGHTRDQVFTSSLL